MVTKRNPEAAQRLILDAAARAFADNGPAGARIDAIAAEAGVNKRMLYHYFGDKEALFAAVLDDRLGGDPGFPTASTLLADGVAMDVLDLRLMVWAAIAGNHPGAGYAGAWQRLVVDLAALQEAGRVREDVDAQCLALVLFAVPAVTALLQQQARVFGSLPGYGAAQLRKLLQPVEASAKQVSGAARPRVRMLPEVRSR